MGQHVTTTFPREVYSSDQLTVIQRAPHSWQHISHKATNDFGNVPCNGLVVRSGNEVIVFDTPTNDTASNELITWIRDSLACSVKAVVPTHFHDDCLGGLRAFHARGIASHAHAPTIALARATGAVVPQHGFSDSLTLSVGTTSVLVKFFGEGHTKDNVVGYFPPDDVLFGGCLIKEVGASKGYLADANVRAWSTTVERVRSTFPHARIVIPGHGEPGTVELLDYTIVLFRGE
jgi:metallo-beta-lactamase class B